MMAREQYIEDLPPPYFPTSQRPSISLAPNWDSIRFQAFADHETTNRITRIKFQISVISSVLHLIQAMIWLALKYIDDTLPNFSLGDLHLYSALIFCLILASAMVRDLIKIKELGFLYRYILLSAVYFANFVLLFCCLVTFNMVGSSTKVNPGLILMSIFDVLIFAMSDLFIENLIKLNRL